MVKNPLANGPAKSHMPRGTSSCVPQRLKPEPSSLGSATTEATAVRIYEREAPKTRESPSSARETQQS